VSNQHEKIRTASSSKFTAQKTHRRFWGTNLAFRLLVDALPAERRVLGLVECANVKQIAYCRTAQTLAGAAATGAGQAGDAVLAAGAGEDAGDFFSSFSLSFFSNMACVRAAGEGRREKAFSSFLPQQAAV
jgi:hypothetical protein